MLVNRIKGFGLEATDKGWVVSIEGFLVIVYVSDDFVSGLI